MYAEFVIYFQITSIEFNLENLILCSIITSVYYAALPPSVCLSVSYAICNFLSLLIRVESDFNKSNFSVLLHKLNVITSATKTSLAT